MKHLQFKLCWYPEQSNALFNFVAVLGGEGYVEILFSCGWLKVPTSSLAYRSDQQHNAKKQTSAQSMQRNKGQKTINAGYLYMHVG